MVPQFFRTKGEAIRAFSDACNAESASHFAKHAEDYMFCRLGSYDDNSGTFENVPTAPEIIITAMDCLVKAVDDLNARREVAGYEPYKISNGKLAL